MTAIKLAHLIFPLVKARALIVEMERALYTVFIEKRDEACIVYVSVVVAEGHFQKNILLHIVFLPCW